MSRRVRVILGVLVFIVSMALLIWGFVPMRRETRIQSISPSEMQVPTPISLCSDPWLAL